MKQCILATMLSVALLSCDNKDKRIQNPLVIEINGYEREQQLAKIRDTFDLKLLEIYNSNFDNQLSKANDLMDEYSNTNSKLRKAVSRFIINDLHYFKAEIFYRNGEFKKSIAELYKANNGNKYLTGDIAAAFASNYIKLKEFDKAKHLVDSIRKGHYIHDYALANYYECVKNKDAAIQTYQNIVNNKAHQSQLYFKPSILRLQELDKKQPNFLQEIIFPSHKPGFEAHNR